MMASLVVVDSEMVAWWRNEGAMVAPLVAVYSKMVAWWKHGVAVMASVVVVGEGGCVSIAGMIVIIGSKMFRVYSWCAINEYV